MTRCFSWMVGIVFTGIAAVGCQDSRESQPSYSQSPSYSQAPSPSSQLQPQYQSQQVPGGTYGSPQGTPQPQPQPQPDSVRPVNPGSSTPGGAGAQQFGAGSATGSGSSTFSGRN